MGNHRQCDHWSLVSSWERMREEAASGLRPAAPIPAGGSPPALARTLRSAEGGFVRRTNPSPRWTALFAPAPAWRPGSPGTPWPSKEPALNFGSTGKLPEMCIMGPHLNCVPAGQVEHPLSFFRFRIGRRRLAGDEEARARSTQRFLAYGKMLTPMPRSFVRRGAEYPASTSGAP